MGFIIRISGVSEALILSHAQFVPSVAVPSVPPSPSIAQLNGARRVHVRSRADGQQQQVLVTCLSTRIQDGMQWWQR